FRSAAITGTVPEQCFNFNAFNLMTIVQSTLGSWSMSTNGGVSHTPLPNNLFNPSGTPVGTSIYNLKYKMTSTPDIHLCPDSSNINVSVLHPATPKIKMAGPFCTQQAGVQLTVSPSTGSWIPSAYTSSTGVFSPSLTVPGNNPVHYVIGTNTCNISQTAIIQTEAFVSAALTGSVPDQCVTSPLVNLSALVVNSGGHWSGQGVIGTNFSPALSGAGLHTIVHSTSSYPSGLCPDQASLAVQVYSLAPPLIQKLDPICDVSLPKQLEVIPVGGVFSSGMIDFISNNGIINPSRAAIGNNIISYSVMVGPCIAYSQSTIEVVKFISADFAKMPEVAYCKNGTPFNLNSLAENATDLGWSGPGVTENTPMFNPAFANIGDNYIVHQTYSHPYGLLCPDSKTIQIKVKDLPKVNADFSPAEGCAPLKVSFTPTTNTTGKGIWTFSDGSSQDGMSFIREFTAAGSYSVLYTFVDDEAQGCSTQVVLNTPLNVFESPGADFRVYPDEIFISDANITLNNQTTNLTENTYTWTIQGLNSYDEVHPNVTLPQVGNYKITLEAASLHNCKSETYKIIEVKNDFNVFIPNSFTPNADGLNDVFRPVFSPYGLDTKTYQMDIFDRWGKVVFSTKDFATGWDGGVQEKGDNPTKQDSFVYKIKFKDLDGRIYEKTGNVLLMVR
ncbi:MAG: gliding motility-associated C-terminal domain-containing protein, partial [Bacteroidia bacterium]|nr:gliding motility-associated C-terminal domain-containing protein [Bacteroidia bacterium]